MAKILITIPDEKYNNLMYGESVEEEDAFEAVDCICNGTVISSNATNGDMIKAMFPNITVRDSYYTYCVEVKLEYHSQHDTGLLFNKKWWNAP